MEGIEEIASIPSIPQSPQSRQSMACRLTITYHGPIRVEGDFEIVDPEGQPIDVGGRRSLALCRCGASRQKPFCDGTHGTVNFRSVVEGKEKGIEGIEGTG
jgi:CDGSH-type Zn-finger protein